MTKFSSASEITYILFGIANVMLTTVAIYTCVKAFFYRLNILTRVLALFIAIVSAVVFICIAEISNPEDTTSILAGLIGELPTYAVTLILVSLSFILAVFPTYLYQKSRIILTKFPIKKSLDNLPDGICYSSEKGMPILVNTKMITLCDELFEASIMNAEQFYTDLKTKPLKNGAELINTYPTVTIRTANQQVWDFRRKKIESDNNKFIELIAYDITTQYKLNAELTERNKRMDALGERLRKFNREVTRVTREKEILNAITKVHDDWGRALLMLRKYLAEPENERDRQKLLFVWQYNTRVMKNETEPYGEGSNWDILLRAAKNIGVKINFKGNLPKNSRQKSVLIAALRECLTNTVKHANGNIIDAKICEKDEKLYIEITNNGKPPEDEIVEKGGLKNLRTIVGDAEGDMLIDSKERFVLKITLPKGE